jgi:hypothetical protein
MNDLYLSKICQFLRPGCGGAAHLYPKSGANGMAMSWDMMVEFEPPLVAGAISNPRSSLAAMRDEGPPNRHHGSQKGAPGCMYRQSAGLVADRFNSRRAAGPGASANELEIWGLKRQISR